MSIDKSGIDDDDVVSMDMQHSLIGAQIFKFSQWIQAQSARLKLSGLSPQVMNNWLDEGVECEVLPASTGGWRKGTLRIHIQIEFIPDEPAPGDDQATNTGL